MKEKRLTITIKRPAREVFWFTLNPANTSKWVESIVEEKTSEWPVKLGTVYRNQNKKGEWTGYRLTDFKENERFEMSATGSPYHVRYTFQPIDEQACELEYFEWVDEGELEEPFTLGILKKLKAVVEG